MSDHKVDFLDGRKAELASLLGTRINLRGLDIKQTPNHMVSFPVM